MDQATAFSGCLSSPLTRSLSALQCHFPILYDTFDLRWSPAPLRPTAFANESKHMIHILGCWDHDQSNTHHDDTALLSEEQVIKVSGRTPWTECYVSGGGVRREKISNDANTCRRTVLLMKESDNGALSGFSLAPLGIALDCEFPQFPSFIIYRRPRYRLHATSHERWRDLGIF